MTRPGGHGEGSRLSALGSRLSALGSRLSALGSRLSALGSRLSALGSRLSLSALGSRLSALGSRLSALGSRLSALGSRLSALGSRLSALGSLYLWEDPCPRAPARASEHGRTSAPIRRRAERTLHRLLTVNEGHLFTPAGRADVLLFSGPFSPSPTQPRAARLGAAGTAALTAHSVARPRGNLLNTLGLLFPVGRKIPDG